MQRQSPSIQDALRSSMSSIHSNSAPDLLAEENNKSVKNILIKKNGPLLRKILNEWQKYTLKAFKTRIQKKIGFKQNQPK